MTTLHFREFQPGDELAFGSDRLASVAATGFVIDAGTADGPRDTLTVNPHDPRPLTVTRAGTTYTPWRYQRWAVVDTETTGLTETDKIVELAVVTMRFGQVIDTFSTLVNPGMPIPPEATAVHGITDAMAENAPTLSAIAPQAWAIASSCAVIAGFNLYSYDEPVMAREGLSIGIPHIDVLPLARSKGVDREGKSARYWKSEAEKKDSYDEAPEIPRVINWRRVGRHSLERVSREFGVNGPETGMEAALHRAAWDAVLTGRCLWKLRRFTAFNAEADETALRAEAERQRNEMDAFMAEMKAKDAAKRAQSPSVETRIAACMSELRELLAMQAGYEAWMRGAKTTETT